MSRLRLVGWNVQPIVMADDGQNLTPLRVDGTMVPASAWEDFKAGGDERALDGLREQLAATEDAET